MKKIAICLSIGLVLILASGCARVIEDGQTGVKISFGHIKDDPLNAGLHFFMPGVTEIENWNVKTQEIQERAQVPSSEGLISRLDVSVLYNISPVNAVKVRKTIGYAYRENVLQPYIREAIRNVASGYPVKALFSDEGRNQISRKILDLLKKQLADRGVTIQDVLLRDVTLPSSFLVSIENKLKAEQEALQKRFELQKAERDAEIEIARAKGAAEANRIIANSITEDYIRYLWVQGLNDGNSEVIYVPTEANLPILEAGKISGRQNQ
jgi:prohibitin 1